MEYCPLCSHAVLRQFRNHQIRWYCQNCHQEVPNLQDLILSRLQQQQAPKEPSLSPACSL